MVDEAIDQEGTRALVAIIVIVRTLCNCCLCGVMGSPLLPDRLPLSHAPVGRERNGSRGRRMPQGASKNSWSIGTEAEIKPVSGSCQIWVSVHGDLTLT
jgi:hypothetical protein